MAPTIILIRHAQALHNVNDDWGIFDPALTEKGIEQCQSLEAQLGKDFPYSKEKCRIVVSPSTRTLQTVRHSLQWLIDHGVPVDVRAEWQESTAKPCDTGSERSKIEREWPDFDFSNLDPVYPQKTGLYGPSEESVQTRAAVERQWLSKQADECIVVVTHSGFLRRVVPGARFKNVEYRKYEVVIDGSNVRLSELSQVVLKEST
ncbi:phosphoglycerate mutase-like protein [Xylariaceae sp. FL0255]|nr:phosphoglycerate mutase-like protein [Xylariaceae sp. FL0255]